MFQNLRSSRVYRVETSRQNITKQRGQGEEERSARVPGSREGLRMSGRWQEQTDPAGIVSALNPEEPDSTKDEDGGEGRGHVTRNPGLGTAAWGCSMDGCRRGVQRSS